MPSKNLAYGNPLSNTFEAKPSEGARVGKYPFITWVNRYLNSVKGFLADSTIMNRRRLYHRMYRELKALEGQGRITTTNPLHLSMDDIGVIVSFYTNKQNWKSTTLAQEFSQLSNLLTFVGNPKYMMFKIRHPGMFPSTFRPRYPPMETESVRKIIGGANFIEQTDWRRMRAYALVMFAIGTGTRAKELRYAKFSDLNLKEGIFHAEKVKGEGKYGHPRDIPILPECIAFLKRYVIERRKMLDKLQMSTDILFPPMCDDGDGVLSDNTIRRIKKIVESETNTSFDLRKCRRTFGQLLLDDGISIETVSVIMGHTTTKTTETYYARRKQEIAIAEAKMKWSRTDSSQSQVNENASIRKKEYISGYA